MKKMYSKPMASLLRFDYAEQVSACSNNTPVIHHGDMGIGLGHGGGCDHIPGHGNPHKPHPGKP